MSEGAQAWWRRDVCAAAVLIAGLLFAGLLLQGVPFWDSDFTLFFGPIEHKSLGTLLWEWVSPVTSDTTNWGYLDRTVQFIVYKISYAVAGYNSWLYLLFRVFCYGGLGLLIYAWSLRVVPPAGRGRRLAAVAAAVFVLVAPGPVAALTWIADFAPASELAFLALTFILWAEIEKTPLEWTGLTPLHERRRWLVKWTALVLAVYLSYKTKADLKLIPAIAAIYLALVRRRQWKLFAAPIGLMMLLAIPWNASLFQRLPPFVPGAPGASENWMWQPASIDRLREFVWSSSPFSPQEATLSLAGVLGPFLLVTIAVFALWKYRSAGAIRFTLETPRSRAHLFVAIWFGVVLAAASVLPAINYFFRIRYGILTLVPASILLASAFGWFAESWPALPRWAIALCLLMFTVQTGINLNRSLRYAHQMDGLQVAVDQAYGFVNSHYPNDDLALMPDVLAYAYRLDASPAILRKDRLGSIEDLALRHPPNRTTVLSWQPSSSASLRQVAHFTGCRPTTLFNRLLPCSPSEGVYVSRFVANGRDADLLRNASTATQLLQLSYTMCQERRHMECIAAAKAAIRLVPGYAEAWNNIAAAYEDMGMWDEAIQAAQEALRLKPDFQLARNNLAWAESQKQLKGTK